ncbi:MAG: hypothetical protein P4L33_08060 [Capsulimonadaceae bacterium]|nr:hypothetical protein [Capsulimonadaceae bacterium]
MSADYLHHLLLPKLLLGAIGTIAILSLVFRENKLYRLFEHVFLGLATGYGLATTWTQVLRPKWWDPMVGGGEWIWILAAPLGLMFYGVYTKKFAWMARLIFGLYFGLAAGTVFQGFAEEYVPQIRASFKPLIAHGAVTAAMAVNNWIFVIILICVLVYFFFAFEQNSAVIKRSASAGRVMLMIAFGAIFGSTIMIREALLIDRIRFLLIEWLQLGHIFR